MPDEAAFERRVTTFDSRRLYEAMGHKVVDFPGLFGPAMIIGIDRENGRLKGAADPRSADGWAAGY
jgi:gamma-glutamyltranspeptidase